MVEKVIVAVDGSVASDAATDWVAFRSRNARLQVDITAIVEPHIMNVSHDGRYDHALTRAAERLKRQSTQASVTKLLWHGELAETLVALSRDADLLVIGTKPISTFTGYLRGTLALALAGKAKCIVVIVPAGWHPIGVGVVAAWKDDSSADRVLDFAADEAERLGEPLHILHAWDVPPPIMGPGTEMLDPGASAMYRQLLSSTMRKIRAHHPTLKIHGDLEEGSVSCEVITAAKDARLLVMGTSVHGAFVRFLIGSISPEVLRNMPCPVALIPPHSNPAATSPRSG